MKCVNMRATAESILFDCPHCDLEAVIEDPTLADLWEHYEGKVTCPVPQGCNMQYEIPTAEEVLALRAGGAPTPIDLPAEAPTEETATGESAGQGEATDTEAEEEKPKFTGPFRYVSKTEEGGNEIEQLLGKDGEEQEEEIQSPLMIRTFRRLECIVQGKNKFDDVVSKFLGEVGRENVISVTPISYTDKSENVTDYGVIVYYTRPSGGRAAEEPKSEPVAWRD